MIDRFLGEQGKARLIQTLKEQVLVNGNHDLAQRVSQGGALRELYADSLLIQQDASDNDIHFLLAGRLTVEVNGREVAIRGPGHHVGEMAVIDPAARRSATVRALELSVILTLAEAEFRDIADNYPILWQRLALELANRLRQRSRFFTPPNPRPVLFIGSSSEALPAARSLQEGLRRDDVVVRVWTDQVFGASRFPIEDLEVQLRSSDFAVLVLAPDDRVTSRGIESQAPRDNTVLELGLFLGALGRTRTFLLCPSGVDLKLPSDLLGITTLKYGPIGSGIDLNDATAGACNDLRNILAGRGVR